MKTTTQTVAQSCPAGTTQNTTTFGCPSTCQPLPTPIAQQSNVQCGNAGSPQCPTSNQVCNVVDPGRLEQPWSGSYCPHAQCYDPTGYVCVPLTAQQTTTVDAGFLCPRNAPLVCGRGMYCIHLDVVYSYCNTV